jgi:hypothetical protein
VIATLLAVVQVIIWLFLMVVVLSQSGKVPDPVGAFGGNMLCDGIRALRFGDFPFEGIDGFR